MLTKNNKIILFSSILLALLVILSVLIWGFMDNKNPDGGNLPLPLLVTILAAAVLSVFVVFFTKIRRKKYEKSLNSAYFEKYEQVKDAVYHSQLPMGIKKEISEDVLELVLSAQNEGKQAEEVYGDVQAFSKNILSAYAKPSRFIFLNLIDSLIALILFVFGVNLFLWLENADQTIFAMRIDIAMIAFFILVAFILVPVIKSQFSSSNPWVYLLPIVGGISFVGVAELLRFYFYENPAVQWFLDGSVRLMPNLPALLSFVVSIPLLLILKLFIRGRILRG